MPETLFISDLHLGEGDPQRTQLFLKFLGNRAKQAETLYILGDLFEVWVGCDQPSALIQQVVQGLRQLTEQGTTVCFMRGNRDFLIAEEFARQTGCRLILDPHVIELNQEAVLLMHGDRLCIDDKGYQKLRVVLHNRWARRLLLSLSLSIRQWIAGGLRKQSHKSKESKVMMIMDVNDDEVVRQMIAHHSSRLIHGHTHRPAVHRFEINQQPVERWVLGEWLETGNAISYQAGCWKNILIVDEK